jgi:uncharacterized LabA/DUF88 family protein
MAEKSKIYKEENFLGNKIFPGDSSESPDDFSKVVVFIDNAYFLRLKKYFFKSGIKFSTKNFIENVVKKNNLVVEKIFLYDAPPFQDKQPTFEEKKMKEIYDKFVFRFRKEGIIVREGRTQRLKVDGSFIYRQKGVDMLLGIDAVSILNSFPKLKKIVLLTGDSDFVPVVERLKEIGIETLLFTYFDRIRKSPFSRGNDLLKSCSKWIKLTKDDFSEVSK